MHRVLRGMVEGAARRARAAGRATAPLLVLFAGELHASLARLFAYGCAIGTLGFAAVAFFAAPHGAVAMRPAQEWITVARPIPAFALTIPEFSDPPQYAIQRHVSGTGRKDIISFEDAGATAVIEILRPGSEPSDETASIPDLRLSKKANTLDTKFGFVTLHEYVDRKSANARRCLRFMRDFDSPRLIINGAFCSVGMELVDRSIVACALDRLTLLSAASEPKIGALFAHAELRRTFCGQRSVFVAATPRRTDWIQASRDPKMRGRQ